MLEIMPYLKKMTKIVQQIHPVITLAKKGLHKLMSPKISTGSTRMVLLRTILFSNPLTVILTPLIQYLSPTMAKKKSCHKLALMTVHK